METVNKSDILDSWIDIEKFSEGDIELKEGGNIKYRQLQKDESTDSWTDFFKGKLSEFKRYKKISNEKAKNMGFTIFFDVFRFDDLINKLSEKFELPEEYREVSNSNKFTYCLSFSVAGDGFKLRDDSLFYTVSGYAHRYGELPDDISAVETDLGKCIAEFFEHDFESGMLKVITQELKWSAQNYYKIQMDVTQTDPLLHSLYIDDLIWAKNENYELLDRYLEGFFGNQINLDSNKDSDTFNVKNITEILEPKNYPLGRFPSNPEWGLSLMQQIAVNVAINDSEKIRGVNGPPGTGKTTLLKDIFAELIVRQAYAITKLENKHLAETYTYFKQGKIAQLPTEIANENILVASSNNGAVQNIVKELPQKEQLSAEFLTTAIDMDYFVNISNSDEGANNWGMFATEGGKSANRQNMLEIVKQMVQELKSESFIPDKEVYSRFIKQYELVKAMQKDAQKVSDAYKKRDKLRSKLESKKNDIQQELLQREENYQQLKHQIEKIEHSIEEQRKKIYSLQEQVVGKNYQIELVNSKIDEVKQRKPSMFAIKKLIRSKSIKGYVEEISELQSSRTNLLQERVELQNKTELVKDQLIKLQEESKNKEKFEREFSDWRQKSEMQLSRLEKKLSSLEIKLGNQDFEPLDLTQKYVDLQQNAPWSTKEYRTEQSKLFIAALEVRKQFLYENVKSLNGSQNIWNRIADYAIPNKKRLISFAWDWINFAIPVISTTFASFHGMFKDMGVETIANLFIDEAGQATPQSAVGAILRSKKVMAVGDPAQIPPVITLSNGVIGLIANKHKASENIVNGFESVQTLVDRASKLGYQKTEDEWIGMPLWVHRRCLDPMFSISNQISYAGQMVLADSVSKPGKGAWIDISGVSDDKFVKEQAIWVRKEVANRINGGEVNRSDIYIISPFKNVVDQLKKYLANIDFPKNNIGTVHTFQGKEATIVYLVLGASFEEEGAARWAVATPNLMNVAATRAKKEFYIIGDKKLYGSLNSEVVNKTLSVLEHE